VAKGNPSRSASRVWGAPVSGAHCRAIGTAGPGEAYPPSPPAPSFVVGANPRRRWFDWAIERMGGRAVRWCGRGEVAQASVAAGCSAAPVIAAVRARKLPIAGLAGNEPESWPSPSLGRVPRGGGKALHPAIAADGAAGQRSRTQMPRNGLSIVPGQTKPAGPPPGVSQAFQAPSSPRSR